MKKRYSIWGTQYGSDHEAELAQCDSNPQPLLDGYAQMTLTIKHSIIDTAKKKSQIRKYTWLHIVDNEASK